MWLVLLTLFHWAVSQNASSILPKLPISKAGALYPDCRAEIMFVLDVSGSVAAGDQRTQMRFVVQFMIQVEQNVKDARFGVVIFGIALDSANPAVVNKYFDGSQIGGTDRQLAGPYGNRVDPASTELLLGLDHLSYNCTNCTIPNWSQLEMMYTVRYSGAQTPTWDALKMVKSEYDRVGDPTVPGRFIVLVTDGVPNDSNCGVPFVDASCASPLNKTSIEVNNTKQGALLLTVGMNLAGPDKNGTRYLMTLWASNPKDILAIPNTDYAALNALIPKLLAVLCPSGKGIDCVEDGVTSIDVVGQGFLNTGTIYCQYTRENEAVTAEHTTKGTWVNSTLIQCPIPTENWFSGEWTVRYTLDGRGYYDGAKFKYGTVCHPQLLVIWWPFCALALLPLAFCRPKRVAPVTTTKVSRGVARPAPAATEEYEEYEEVEEIVAPPEPVNKWKVAPTAYIGFGRARMSVDWAGVAPESAPHEGVRKKVVKKVVRDTEPVPTAGPVGTPTPAAPQETTTTTVTQSRPPIVEEPDWVNSFMDRIAAIFCCCCVKKK